jgi:hypothetical protein
MMIRNQLPWEGGEVPEEAVEHKVEVDVGHRRYHRADVGEGPHLMPDFIGERPRRLMPKKEVAR